MKIKFLATGNAPDYIIDDDIINGIDLSMLAAEDQFVSTDDTRAAGVRHAERDANQELWVTLTQAVGPGHWSESSWIDAANYDPDAVYAVYDEDRPYAGSPWAQTARGRVHPITGEVLDNE